MDLVIMDTNLKTVAILDSFESLIWTDRYSSYGDFEVYTAMNNELLSFLRHDYYIWARNTDHVMIIEDLQIKSDSENGNNLIITGRSLESILDRRIVWAQTMLNGNFQNGIQKLLNENVINPTDPTRKVNNFVFQSSNDPNITSLSIEAQFTGTNLYDAIKKLCDSNNIGFKITLSSDGKFVFSLYSGVDRSYGQFSNPYVVFSPNFENIINSNYFESKKALKTITLVAGEGEGQARKKISVAIDSGAGDGLTRREMFTDARDISSEVDGRKLTEAQYNAQLSQRGLGYLSENLVVKTFEGQVDATVMFKYGEDFFMGDIVQIVNEYGIESKSRVTEIVNSINPSGIETFPTFTTIE